MASRKRLTTPKMIDVLDISSRNATKTLGILFMLQEQVKDQLVTEDNKKDFEAVMWTLTDLIHEIKKANDVLDGEEAIYADTLEEFLAEEKAERAQALNS
jgi:hypothetical protein